MLLTKPLTGEAAAFIARMLEAKVVPDIITRSTQVSP
jgi:hypothetical protein